MIKILGIGILSLLGLVSNQAQEQSCPECRNDFLARPIAILSMETMLQNRYPKAYAERYAELHGQQPQTWKDDPAFLGSEIQYRS